MTPRRRGWLVGLTLTIALAVGLGVAPADDRDKARGKKFIPDAAFKTLVEREAKIIRKNLEGDPEKDQLSRAQAGAVMIVAFAAAHEKSDATIEAYAKTAQEIGQAIRARGQLAQARKLADDLSQGKVDAKAGKAKAAWRSVELGDLMNPLHIPKKGGDGLPPELQTSIRLKAAGIEEKLRSLSMKELSKTNMEKASKELVLLSYRLGALGEIVPEYPLPKKGKGTAKDWLAMSLDMRDAALELAAAAQRKDAAAVKTAGTRLSGACSQCHAAFK